MDNRTHIQQALCQSRILIVDDSESTRMILRSYCAKAGLADIHEASDGEQALAMILQQKPDLIFLDMQMPRMNGLELCHALRERGLLDDIIVIVQTATESRECKAQAFEAGATDLISKPLDQRETMARALSHLERHLLRREADAEYRRIQQELSEAVILQNVLLPDQTLLDEINAQHGIDIAHYYHPASELAGDYLSVRRQGDGRIVLASVDIAGHGLSAALYAFSIHTLLEDQALTGRSPSEMLAILNQKLHAMMSVGKFATMFLAVIDPQAHLMHYTAAASPPPILVSNGRAMVLDTRGHLLGIQEDASYDNHSLPYQKGDILFIYSDALIEASQIVGHDELDDVVKVLLSRPDMRAGEVLRKMLESFYGRLAGQPVDDLSMLACKF